MAHKSGLVKLNQIAVDGIKIKANASKHSAMSYGYMKKEEDRLRKEIENLLKDAERIDRDEDHKYGNRRGGDELPEELSTREKRLGPLKKPRPNSRRKPKPKQNENKPHFRQKPKPIAISINVVKMLRKLNLRLRHSVTLQIPIPEL